MAFGLMVKGYLALSRLLNMNNEARSSLRLKDDWDVVVCAFWVVNTHLHPAIQLKQFFDRNYKLVWP